MYLLDEVEQQQQYWQDLVARIAAGEPGGRQEFRSTYRAGIRFLLQRRFGEDQLDAVVDVTVGQILEAISEGRLTTVAEMARYIRRVMPRGEGSAEVTHEDRERAQERVRTLEEVLQSFNSVEREALVSYYARGFNERDIEAEFGYEPVAFRHLRERLVRGMSSARARRGPTMARRPMLRAHAAGGAA